MPTTLHGNNAFDKGRLHNKMNILRDVVMELKKDVTHKGYNYTYLYPGLQKVVQAAGRVIRTQQDKGVIYLMDRSEERRVGKECRP